MLKSKFQILFTLILSVQNTTSLTEREWLKFLNQESHVVYERLSKIRSGKIRYINVKFLRAGVYINTELGPQREPAQITS